jgi:phosphate transport system substrate-binding protein
MTEPTLPGDQPQPEDVSEEIAELKEIEKEEKKEGSRLAVFLFLATLFGSLLGAAADISEVEQLAIPILEWIDPGPRLRITGSDSVLGDSVSVAKEWTEGFTNMARDFSYIPILGLIERTPHIDVEPKDSLVALRSAADGETSVIVVTEPMSSATQQKIEEQGITVRCAAVIGFDVISFVTHLENEDPPLTRDEISKILTGEVTDWSQLGRDTQPINVFGDPDSAATDIILKTYTGSDEFRPHMIECSSEADCFNKALATRGSFCAVSTSWLKDQPARYLNGIALKDDSHPPQDPLRDDFNADWYPNELIRPIYMYVLDGGSIDQAASDLGVDFIEFVRGSRGQAILERNDFYTYFDPPTEIQPELPPGFGHRPTGAPVVCKSTQ